MAKEGRGVRVGSHLGARVGTGKQDTGDLAGKGSGLAGLAAVAESLDGGDGDLLLAEAGLGEGHEDRDEEDLGHGERWVVEINTGYTRTDEEEQTELAVLGNEDEQERERGCLLKERQERKVHRTGEKKREGRTEVGERE